MKIFSYTEKNTLINHTIAHSGITAVDLVDRVGRGVANEISARWPKGTRILVFAGWDTNGAEALETSRHLSLEGYTPEVYLFNIGGKRLTPTCAACRKRLLKAFPDCNFHEVVQDFETPDINPQTVVVDGLFGAELDRALPRSFGMLIRSINESGAKIVSIDIPTGLFSEWNTTNAISRDIIHATLTVAIETPYLSFFFDDNASIVGEWLTIDADVDHEAVRKATYTYYLVTRRDIHRILRPRSVVASKADFGNAVICAGSHGMTGAALLATIGCLRAGAGKVTCYGPKSAYHTVQSQAPSAMFVQAPGDVHISSFKLDRGYTGVGIGPGLGTADETINALEAYLKQACAISRPLVLDADALNCMAQRQIMLTYMPQLSVLTPHPGEFDRLFGAQPSSEARLRKAMEVATHYNVVIVLKGHHTAVVRPDGKVHINSSGTPALATGGSGDVLTGVITGLMAQGYSPEMAAIVGVYVHGVAGELAEEVHGSYGVTAMDVAENIGRAIKKTMEK